MGVLCALALLLTVSFDALADEDSGRLRPTSRGGRVEAPVDGPPVVVSPVAVSPVAPIPTLAPPPPAPSLSQRVVELAQQYVGTPYLFGGASPATGFDCSGFVQWVLGQFGVPVGRSAAGQYSAGESVPPDQLEAGDLIFFANTYMPGISHVGVYLGDGQFVDAGTERTGVRRARLTDPYWASRYVGARRIR